MFKNILYLSIIGALSISSQADGLNELESLYADDITSSTEEISIDDLDVLFSEDIPDVNIDIDKGGEKIIDMVEVNPIEELESFSSTEELLNTVFTDSNSNHRSLNINTSDAKFLKYVPEDSHLVFKEHLYIPRTKDTFIYSYGQSILSVDKDDFSVCYIKFSKSNKPRELLKNREFLITKNITKKAITKSNNKNVYFSTFVIENPNINYIKCISNETTSPLTTDDFDTHFGGSVIIKFPEYEKI